MDQVIASTSMSSLVVFYLRDSGLAADARQPA